MGKLDDAKTRDMRKSADEILRGNIVRIYENVKAKWNQSGQVEQFKSSIEDMDRLKREAGEAYEEMDKNKSDTTTCARCLTTVQAKWREIETIAKEVESSLELAIARTRVTAEAEARMTVAIQTWQTLLANNELGLQPGALDGTISEMQEKLVEVKAASLEDYPGVLNTFLGLVKAMESGFREASFRNNAAIEQKVGNRLLDALFGAVEPPTPEVLNAVPEEATVDTEEAEEPDNGPKPRINS